MKRSLFRIENLLFLIPLLPYLSYLSELWTNWYGQNRYESFGFGVQTRREFFVFFFIGPAIHLLALVLPLYMMHYFLRVINMRNSRICGIHAVATVIYAIYAESFPIAFSVVPGWHTSIYPPGFLGGLPFWIGFLCFLLQAAFIIYGFITIRRWRKMRA